MAKRKAAVAEPEGKGEAPAGMPDVRGPPDAGQVIGLWEWKNRDPEEIGLKQFIRQIRQLDNLAQPIRIPTEYKATSKEVRTPFVRDAARRIAASLVKDPPVPSVEPRDEQKPTIRAASIAARYLKALFAAIDKEQGTNMVYMSSLHLVRDSESVLKTVHRPDAWANFPERSQEEDGDTYTARTKRWKKHRKTRQPFSMRVVDRLQMVFGDGEYGDQWAIEYGEYSLPYRGQGRGSLNTTADKITPATMIGSRPRDYGGLSYSDALMPSGQSSGGAGTTKKWEYWDADWWVVVINGTLAPGFPKQNPYGCVPYHRAEADPCLYSLLFLVPELDSLMTMQNNWAYLSAWPVPQLKQIATGQMFPLDSLPTGDDGTKPKFKFTPGKVNVPPAGYELVFVEPPGSGRDLTLMIQEVRNFIDIAGIPSIFRGVAGARQPGYAVNQLMAAANLSYRMMGQALQRQFENAAEFFIDCVESVIDDDVYILGGNEDGDAKQWLGLKPTGAVEDECAPVDMLATVEMRFRPVLPTDEQVMAMLAIQLVNSPKQILSLETALRDYLQSDDPLGEIDKIWVEQAMSDPALRQPALDAALRRAGVTPPPAPASSILGPDGNPLPPSGNGAGPMSPYPDGRTAEGMPTIPGLTMPPIPAPPTGNNGGRPAGAYPGIPGGPNRAA